MVDDQVKYDHFFGRAINDRQFATSGCQIKSDHLYVDFGHLFGNLALIFY